MIKQLKFFLVLIGLLVLASGWTQAAEIYVDNGDGTNGTCTLAEAILSANNDNADGNGCEDGSGDDTIFLETNITLAAALPQISTVITIEGSGHFISGNNDENVGSVLHIIATGNLTLNDATVTEGTGYEESEFDGFSSGGGIYNQGGTVTLNASTVSGNTNTASPIPYYGGGVFNDTGGTVTLNDSVVSGNSAQFGGGIYNRGTVTLNDSAVSDNTATFHSYSCGGGIYNSSDSTVTLTNSTVSGNTASADYFSSGGGIYNRGTVTLNDSAVSDNTAFGDIYISWGGGVCNYGGTVTLNGSTVSGNTASAILIYGGGGGISNDGGGTITLNASTVSGNTASTCNPTYGGGVYNSSDSTVTLTNSTVSGNTTSGYFSSGSGIYNYGTVTLTNSTVSDNTGVSCTICTISDNAAVSFTCIATNGGDSIGGGIYNSSDGTVTLHSSLISGNTAMGNDNGKEVFSSTSGTIYADSFNLFGHNGESNTEAFIGFTPGASDIDATGSSGTALEDILSPLADNGGLTMTHALVSGSPAIDLDEGCSPGLDQRGESRPFGAGCDAGSFEFNDAIVVPSFINQPPIADAGSAQSALEGDTVCFDGSGSTDADGDEVEYLWSLDAWPEGSAAELDDPNAETTCLVVDFPGTYEVSLVVNDGLIDSEEDIAEAVVVSYLTAVTETLEDTATAVNEIDTAVLKNAKQQNALTNKVNAAFTLIDEGSYAKALDKLRNDILAKTDGCAASEPPTPDRNDWIKDCGSQEQVFPLIMEAIGYLESMI